MARKTLAERKATAQAELRALQERMAKIEAEEAARIGKLAIKAGLGDLNFDDDEMLAELQKFVASFRAQPAVKAQAASAEGGGAGTVPVAHE
jgi:hypothetical protein